ncbi:unnamed protein product [Cylicocyclus nassatus]|uniref:Uncharacterized protein n=1 Tax=Cylicocyclus nassatus TaxID=53992 RepID=A0AA36H1J2_CYLNA|nr:unnamed protein product [Cylicocyclus nassatus]
MTSVRCFGEPYKEWFFWFDHYAVMDEESLLEYLSRELTRIEEEAPKNITNDAVLYNDTDPVYGSYGSEYNLFVYLNLMNANARKFACILVDETCPNLAGEEIYICATEQAALENGDIVYEIAGATTKVATTTKAATTSVTTTAKATTSAATTAKATTNVTTTVTSLKSVATSSTPTLPKHITECASAPTTPSCITQSPKRVRREAKASPFEDFLMKKPAPAKGGGKSHRKKTLTAHRTHAAKTATGEN